MSASRQAPACWPATLLRGGVPRVRTWRRASRRGASAGAHVLAPHLATGAQRGIRRDGRPTAQAPKGEDPDERHHPELVLRDAPDARRPGPRPDHGRAGAADLPDHLLRVQRHRARGEPVRAQGVRQHLHPDHEPDARTRSSSASPASRVASAPCWSPPGQAAETVAILNVAEAGDHVVASPSLYGGTYNLLKYTLRKLGIETTFVEDPDDLDSWRAAVRPNTKLFFAETISNPKQDVLDIEGVAARGARGRRAAHRRQHHRDAVPHPPAGVGRRRRRCTRRPSTSAATAPPSAASSSTAARSTSPPTRPASPTTTSPTRATTASSTAATSASAALWAPTSRSSSRRACSCCATSARPSRRSTRSSSPRASRR